MKFDHLLYCTDTSDMRAPYVRASATGSHGALCVVCHLISTLHPVKS